MSPNGQCKDRNNLLILYMSCKIFRYSWAADVALLIGMFGHVFGFIKKSLHLSYRIKWGIFVRFKEDIPVFIPLKKYK